MCKWGKKREVVMDDGQMVVAMAVEVVDVLR